MIWPTYSELSQAERDQSSGVEEIANWTGGTGAVSSQQSCHTASLCSDWGREGSASERSGCKAHSLIATSKCPLLVLESGHCPLFSRGNPQMSLWPSVPSEAEFLRSSKMLHTSTFIAILIVWNCYHQSSGSIVHCRLFLFSFLETKDWMQVNSTMRTKAFKLNFSPLLSGTKNLWMKWILAMVPGKLCHRQINWWGDISHSELKRWLLPVLLYRQRMTGCVGMF